MTKYFLGVLLQAWGLRVRMWGSYCCPSVVDLYLDRNLALDPLPLSVTEPAWVPAAPCSVLPPRTLQHPTLSPTLRRGAQGNENTDAVFLPMRT